jgi:lysozyme
MPAISNECYDLIKEFEGERLTAYLDGKGVPTIGIGHTKGVKLGQVITKEQSKAFFIEDTKNALSDVLRLVKVPLEQGQLDALVSFTFNLGGRQLSTSTLLKKLNKGDYKGAANEFPRWKYDNGEVQRGLVRRRDAEMKLFLRDTK